MKTIFENATFHTMESESDKHASMTVEGDIITGFDEDIAASNARRVDLGGMHVFPALIDAHLHLLDSIALASMGEPVCELVDGGVEPHNLAGIERKIRALAEHAQPSSLLIFTNYITAAMDEGRLPNRFELDAWGSGARVWVLNIDGHSSACSSSLLEALELEGIAPDGVLAGPAHDANLGAFTDHLATSITPRALAHGIAHVCNECARFGIGTVCALEGTDDSERDRMAELTALIAQRLPLDARLFPQYMDEKKLQAVQGRMRAPRVGGCMKWELDGSVGSRTAAFVQPYLDGTQGSLYFEDGELSKAIEHFANRGFMVSAHAIGDAAIDQLVDIFEQVPGRHRIDHCEFPSPHAVERICKLKPFVTVQPGYAWIDQRFLHGYERYLSAPQIASQIPLARFAQAGVPLCGSSDSPVQSVDPFLQMRGMREFSVQDQSLSAYEALKTYTVNGGQMLGEKKGLLREGWEASFFTCEENLLDIESAALDGMCAQVLWLRGKRYQPLPDGLGAFARLLATRPRKI
ncbi:MAG: amidohydrolase family protein [Gordonibacter sp.]